MALIVNMKMPMNCRECPMRKNYAIQDKDRGTTYCAILNLSNGGFTDRRPSWCPILCEIPDEHGELMDKEAFFESEKGRTVVIGRAGARAIRELYERIEKAPAVVEAAP